MGFRESREALAAAAGTVPGVTGYADPPAAPQPGDAWPQIARISPRPFPSVLWTVVVVLGSTPDEANLRLDDLYVPMAAALEPVMPLTDVSPGTLQVAGQQLMAVEFFGRLEVD